jgi:2'-5' RNA ligase
MNFVDPALIHITVKFLGEVDEKDLSKICASLGSVSFEKFPVTVGTVTVNNPKRPFTVWCAISDNGRGKELFRNVEAALEPLGIARERRGFTPHATLARIRTPDPSLFEALHALNGITYGSCLITGMKLKKSTLTPHGPIYEDLMEVEF